MFTKVTLVMDQIDTLDGVLISADAMHAQTGHASYLDDLGRRTVPLGAAGQDNPQTGGLHTQPLGYVGPDAFGHLAQTVEEQRHSAPVEEPSGRARPVVGRAQVRG